MKTFLRGLGFSSYEASRLIDTYGTRSLKLIETAAGRNKMASVVEPASVTAAHLQYTRMWRGTEIYKSLEPFGVPAECIYRFYCSLGGGEAESTDAKDKAMEALASDPFLLVGDFGAPFPAVLKAARKNGWTIEKGRMAEAAVIAVLSLTSGGGEEFGQDDFAREINTLAGSTCLPLNKVIDFAKELLKYESVSEEDIMDAVYRLHFAKRILFTKKQGGSYIYIASNAETEFEAARMIRERLDKAKSFPVRFSTNPYETIDTAQTVLGLYLSYEQVDAVMTALKNRIAVITGGPGTGKTQTEKILLEAYRRLSGGKPVTLVAPTGQAAKRMTASTGYPASTIHLALGIFPGETDPGKAKMLPDGLLVIDEASMLDNELLRMLLAKTPDSASIVFIGDADQLPSIGAGNVFEELTRCVPVARLTKIFRQGGDAADIAYNAARIKTGTTQMIEGDRFSFVKAGSSGEIQKTVCELYKKAAEKSGLESVVVLSPLRRFTETGVNLLNTALRKTVSDETRYVEYEGTKLYLNDKVVFLRNKLGLVNGDIGKVSEIRGETVVCSFGDITIKLSGSELSWVTPAYAETIHKSQGDEYPIVILVADESHPNSKALVYTAVTRAKERVIVVGSKAAFENAVKNTTAGRCSCLSKIVNA